MGDTQRQVPGFTAPERIELGGLVLRRGTMSDLPGWFAAIDESYPQPHQWMDWWAQPPSLQGLRCRTSRTGAGIITAAAGKLTDMALCWVKESA